MWVPILVTFFVGTIELARVSYTYYALQKALYTVARVASNSTSANLCDDQDQILTDAKNLAVWGGIEETSTPPVQGLDASMIEVSFEKIGAEDGSLGECDCSASGCDTASGGSRPDYVVVTIPDGYPIQLRIPMLSLDPIPLRPRVRVPYGGL